MNRDTPCEIYRAYIDCLNRQDWGRLGQFVDDDVERNGVALGLSGYRKMLENDFRAIPDLRFAIDLLIADPPRIASRLLFDCTPVGELFGIPVNGKRVQFSENVFYELADGLIRRVWSVIDQTAIVRQVGAPGVA